MVARPDRLGDLCGVASPLEVLLSDSLFDSIDLVLVSLPVSHGPLLGFFQGSFQSLRENYLNVDPHWDQQKTSKTYLYSFHSSTEPLLEFWKFAAKISIVSYKLLVDFGQLI